MGFHWNLTVSKPSKVSRTLPSVLADLKNVVVCIVYTNPVNSKSSTLSINLFANIPITSIRIGITVTFMFLFCNSLSRSRNLCFFSLSFNFTQWSAEAAKSTILQVWETASLFKSPRLCILTDHHNTAVWMVSPFPLISNLSNLVTEPITNHITVTFMFAIWQIVFFIQYHKVWLYSRD